MKPKINEAFGLPRTSGIKKIKAYGIELEKGSVLTDIPTPRNINIELSRSLI